MRFLVTGAGGFIGSQVAWGLCRDGHEVWAADHFECGVRENLAGFPGPVEKWDFTEAVPESWGKFHAVFHHGDITDPRFPDDSVVLKRNLACFENVLAVARRSGGRLTYASSAGVYGNGPCPMREDQTPDLITAYGRSKWEMDQRAARWGQELPVVGLRYFNVYGPGEGHKGRAASMVWHLARQMAEGRRPRLFEWGEQRRDFIHVDDLVEANRLSLKGPSGVYNVGTGRARTFLELVAALNSALGTELEPEFFPMPYNPATYQTHTEADPQRAREQLHFSARLSLEAGVKQYVKWMREHGHLPEAP